MTTFYLDYENGLDSNDGLGWWFVDFTNGWAPEPLEGESVTGQSSGATARVSSISSITGTWDGGDAAGRMYFYGKSGTFTGENLMFGEGGQCTTATDISIGSWKTITSGATAARIAPGDIIRIAKSGSPTSIGTATWTYLSKVVLLDTPQTGSICMCESNWTAIGGGDTTPALVGVATDAKEGSNCVRLTLDSAPQASASQAYFATGTLNLSNYQNISFWIKNSAATAAENWNVNLCSDTSGATVVDKFLIPAIPSTTRWIPFTIARIGGGNLGSSIRSINISTGSIAPTASSNILIDNFIACKTGGLNLQSVISKNGLDQGGTEGYYGIQSISSTGSVILLDNDSNSKSNAGRGYSGTTESVTTYKRETIKTAIAGAQSTSVQAVQESGGYGNVTEFQGGYDTSTNEQNGETFFDGSNGYGTGIYASGKSYIRYNLINVYRYYNGIDLSNCINFTIQRISNANNNTTGILVSNCVNRIFLETISNANNNGSTGITLSGSTNIRIQTISSVCNNLSNGFSYTYSDNNTTQTISNANNNNTNGVIINGCNNTIQTISNAKNNGAYGVNFGYSDNTIDFLNTSGNAASFNLSLGNHYINKAVLSETSKINHTNNQTDGRVYISSFNGGFPIIYGEYFNILAQDATAGGTGLEWKMNITGTTRDILFPVTLKIAEVAVSEGSEVTATCYFKQSSATDIGSAFVLSSASLLGLTSASTVCPSDTNRNQLTLNFTSSASGVVELSAYAWFVSSPADENVIVDSFSVTQA